MSVILYPYVNNIPWISPDVPDVVINDYFTAQDTNYYTKISTEASGKMKCMIFKPYTDSEGFQLIIDTLEIMIIKETNVTLTDNAIELKVYEISAPNADEVTIINTNQLTDTNYVTSYFSNSITTLTGKVCSTNCTSTLPLRFEPNNVIRNSYFIIGIRLTNSNDDVYIAKFNQANNGGDPPLPNGFATADLINVYPYLGRNFSTDIKTNDEFTMSGNVATDKTISEVNSPLGMLVIKFKGADPEADLIVYYTESPYDGRLKNYSYFNDLIVTDPTYKLEINDNTTMRLMGFIPYTPQPGYTMNVTNILLPILTDGPTKIPAAGDIIIRIYEYSALDTPTLDANFFADTNNFVTRYTLSNVIADLGGIENLYMGIFTYTGGGYNEWSFVLSQSRATIFILAVQVTNNTLLPVTIFKSANGQSGSADVFSEIDPSVQMSGVNYLNGLFDEDDIYTIATNTDTIVTSITPGTSNNLMGSYALNLYGSITSSPVCFHGLSLVHTSNGIVHAKDVTKNDKLISNNEEVEIETILKTKGCTDIVRIKKGSINENYPYSDFYVTRTHMIKVGDEELQAQELLDKYEGVSLIELTKPCDVYSFITKNGNYVNINGLNVKTFNSNELIY